MVIIKLLTTSDISIAVSGPKGLMVPVVRNAENLTFRGVEADIKD
jgi:2-oxoglutarate dehydrogenase E2 component (dihydrolipoamide succinyltransferase)